MAHFSRQTIHLKNSEIHLIFFNFFDFEPYLSLLSEKEAFRFANFGHSQRKREFLATRILKHELFGTKEIQYTNNGSPFIEDDSFISISHTKNCAAIACCKEYAIGLDLELVQAKARNVQRRFISENELHFLDITDDLQMSQAWSCKEALYKLAGRKEILFKEHLNLLKFENNRWEAEIINPTEKLFVKLLSHREGDLIITINTEQVERRSIGRF